LIICTCICSEIAHVDVTFFFSSPPVSFLFWCICVCIVLFQATSFNERNAFLVAFQVLRHLLHCNFSAITWKINFDWLIDCLWTRQSNTNVCVIVVIAMPKSTKGWQKCDFAVLQLSSHQHSNRHLHGDGTRWWWGVVWVHHQTWQSESS